MPTVRMLELQESNKDNVFYFNFFVVIRQFEFFSLNNFPNFSSNEICEIFEAHIYHDRIELFAAVQRQTAYTCTFFL